MHTKLLKARWRLLVCLDNLFIKHYLITNTLNPTTRGKFACPQILNSITFKSQWKRWHNIVWCGVSFITVALFFANDAMNTRATNVFMRTMHFTGMMLWRPDNTCFIALCWMSMCIDHWISHYYTMVAFSEHCLGDTISIRFSWLRSLIPTVMWSVGITVKRPQAMETDDNQTYVGILYLAATADQWGVYWNYAES